MTGGGGKVGWDQSSPPLGGLVPSVFFHAKRLHPACSILGYQVQGHELLKNVLVMTRGGGRGRRVLLCIRSLDNHDS